MSDNDRNNANKNFEQLKTLGQILELIQNLNIDELEVITTGSHLGEAVQLLKNVKNNLNLALNELEKEENTINSQLSETETSTETAHQELDKTKNTKQLLIDYLTNEVFADTEIFADRKSIADFFKEYFDIDYTVKKESRKELINRVYKILLEKNISIDALGDALLKKTNSKYGSFLKEKETGFLKSWYEAIEKM
ncbi:MAG TPA: hypothetical protein V6D25_20185 [Leptolyngbyaceae cyanobacterium]